MYLRETHQKRADGTVLTHLQLVESVWNPQKKRSEIRIVSKRLSGNSLGKRVDLLDS